MTADPAAPHYGYDLMKAAKLPSGTLYPMLARLQQDGLVDAEWEAQREDAGGRPPRKYYRLTADVRAERCREWKAELPATSFRRLLPVRHRPGRAGALPAQVGVGAHLPGADPARRHHVPQHWPYRPATAGAARRAQAMIEPGRPAAALLAAGLAITRRAD
jgi:PadR family transcriptional regulator, regulatory protein PadR